MTNRNHFDTRTNVLISDSLADILAADGEGALLGKLEACAAGLDRTDWAAFAERVSAEVDETLGAYVECHADAADGNSPDVAEWPQYTLDDARLLAQHRVSTPGAARALFADQHTEDG